MTIDRANSDDELTEFWLFANEVYAERPVHWTTTSDDLNPLLKGEVPAATGRTMSAFVARSRGKVVARAAAVVDEHYMWIGNAAQNGIHIGYLLRGAHYRAPDKCADTGRSSPPSRQHFGLRSVLLLNGDGPSWRLAPVLDNPYRMSGCVQIR